MRTGAVVFGHKAVTHLAREHFFLGATDNIDFTVLGAAQDNLDLHLVPLQRDFGANGVLERFRKCIRSVENAPIVDVGDGDRYLLAFCFTGGRLDRDTTLARNASNGHLRKSLQKRIVKATAVLRSNGAGQHGSRGIGRPLTLQSSHVRTKGSEHVPGWRVVHRKPLTSAFVLHRTVLLGQVVHHGIRWRRRWIVSDCGPTCDEWISTWHARASHAAGQRWTSVGLGHV